MVENSPMPSRENLQIHQTAEIAPTAEIGEGSRLWHWVQVREGARIGSECILGRGVYIDRNVEIGNKVKIQNNVSIFEGVTIADGVFVGPHVCFTNDKLPRAVNENFELSTNEDWELIPTLVKKGASIGANSTILPGITIGEFAMVGAGSVVTKDIPDYYLAFGNPAQLIGEIDQSGTILE